MAELRLRDIYTAYDQADVLSGVSLNAPAGGITCILGSNGAGKTTLIRSVLGLTTPRSGSITYDGADLVGRPTHETVALGIACIPEGRKVFPKMTVGESVRRYPIGRPTGRDHPHGSGICNFPRACSNGEVGLPVCRGQQACFHQPGLDGRSQVIITTTVARTLADVREGELQCHPACQRNGCVRSAGGAECEADTGDCPSGVTFCQGRGGAGGAEELRNNDQVRQAYFG